MSKDLRSKDQETMKLTGEIKMKEKAMNKIMKKLWSKEEKIWNLERKVDEIWTEREIELKSMIKFGKEQIQKLQDYIMMKLIRNVSSHEFATPEH